MCLTGTVVVSWPLTQEVAGWSPFTVMRNIFGNLGKTQMAENLSIRDQKHCSPGDYFLTKIEAKVYKS